MKTDASPLNWLAGSNKPNALGYTEIDPARWDAVKRELQHHTAGDTGEHVALKTPPRPGFHFALGRAAGRVSYHRNFATAERLWHFGDTVYQWDGARWRIWTSAGLF